MSGDILTYEPAKQRTSSAEAFVITLIFATLVTAFFVAVIVSAVPPWEQLLKDFKVSLPAASVLVLSSARFFKSTGGILWIWLVPVAFALVAQRWCQNASHRRLLIVIMLIAVLSLLLGAFLCAAWLMPFVNLLNALSGPGK